MFASAAPDQTSIGPPTPPESLHPANHERLKPSISNPPRFEGKPTADRQVDLDE